MSLHSILTRLAVADDNATARVIAVALNADQEIRRINAGGALTVWTADDVLRVARALADHAVVGFAPATTQAGVDAVQDALADQPA